MDTSKNNKLAFGIEQHPLTNHFNRPHGLSHSYDEISTLIRQFGSSDDIVAKEIKKLLMMTEKFIIQTDSDTKAQRATNPKVKNMIEKSITEFKEIHVLLTKQLSSMTDAKEKSILQIALTYSADAIQKRLNQLRDNSDPINEFANSAFIDFFKDRDGTHSERPHR